MREKTTPSFLFLRQILKKSPYFRQWPAQAFQEMVPFFRIAYYQKGEVFIHENRRAPFLFILGQGAVALSVRSGTGDLIIEILKKKGDLLGWSALVAPRRYTASAKALSKVKALQIRGQDLENYLRSRPHLGLLFWPKLASLVASRLEQMLSLLLETMI